MRVRVAATAARVALSASVTRSFFSLTSVSVAPPLPASESSPSVEAHEPSVFGGSRSAARHASVTAVKIE